MRKIIIKIAFEENKIQTLIKNICFKKYSMEDEITLLGAIENVKSIILKNIKTLD